MEGIAPVSFLVLTHGMGYLCEFIAFALIFDIPRYSLAPIRASSLVEGNFMEIQWRPNLTHSNIAKLKQSSSLGKGGKRTSLLLFPSTLLPFLSQQFWQFLLSEFRKIARWLLPLLPGELASVCKKDIGTAVAGKMRRIVFLLSSASNLC